MTFKTEVQRHWYNRPGWLWLLLPLEWIFRGTTALRRWGYRAGIFTSWRAPVPVIVIGNISVGGTGKTPVAIALCAALQRAGFRPGVISRGYLAQPPAFPHRVAIDDNAQCSGDEPLLIARRSGCPVVIAPQRAAAAQTLLQHDDCDVLICDDGLQHYALQRDIECAVIDAARGFGNGHCLPVGPLREPLSRLRRVDAVLVNGATANASSDSDASSDSNESSGPLNRRFGFRLVPSAVINLSSGETLAPEVWAQRFPRTHALAGIGNPARFFAALRALGCAVLEHPFPDHHTFSAADLQFGDALPLVMTEKDAVKCSALATEQHWYLRVDAALPESLISALIGKLRAVKS